MKEENIEFQQTTETGFWEFINEQNAQEQKGMEYNHLYVSGKTGFYKKDNPELFGYVVRVLSHRTYFIRK